MHRTPVGSSAVESVGYDAARRVLQIEYEGGAVYDYLDVPPEEHDALLGSESKGKFVNERIKPRYRYRRVA